MDAVSLTVNPGLDQGISGSLKNKVKDIGQFAQKRISDVTSIISDRARMVSIRASNIMVQDKVAEAMRTL